MSSLPALERSGSLLVAQPEEEPPSHDDEAQRQDMLAEAELYAPALEAALVLMLRSKAGSLEEALELMEAWSPAEAAKHPRWPKGTPGGLAGKFMARGQRFALHGIQYDVDFGVPGGVYAHVATHGDISAAKHVFIPASAVEKDTGATVVKGITRPPAEAEHYANAAHNATANVKATVIDPYVQPDHDPSIPIPPDAPATLTPERWKRFGRADQMRYVDLQHQFGAWKDSVAQTKLNAELAKQPGDAVDFLKGAYQSQFGSSSGFTIGLLQVFTKWFQGGKKPSQAELEKDRDQYERLKKVQDAAGRVIQWDLYNRVASPDITVFHKSGDSPQTWKAKWLGKEPIFSGLSQSQRYTPGGFGPTGVATPLAIRNIVMASTSASVYQHSGYIAAEQEVSVGEPMRYDSRSFVFPDSALSSGERQALTNLTQSGSDGSTVDLIRNRIEHGEEFPEIPIPPNLVMQSEKAFIAPPHAATVGIGKLDYAEKDADGVPVAHPAKELDLKPGDYIEGMKGTRYIVVANASSEYGVSYYKVTDSGHPVGPKKPYVGEIHDKETGHQAYGGHADWAGGAESYDFQFELPFKKLAGHYDLPTQKQGVAEFVPGAWSQSGDKVKVSALPLGSKFYVGSTPLEVAGLQGAHDGAVGIKSLLSGEPGTVSGGYKTTYLKLKDGYTAEGVPAFDPGAYFEGKKAPLAELDLKEGDVFLPGAAGTSMAWQVVATHGGAPIEVVGLGSENQGKKNVLALSTMVGRKLTPKPADWTPPQVGDTLAIGGKKGEVTKLLKGGVVQVNTHPGVVKLQPDDPLLAGLFSADKHAVGPKMKVKDMQPGVKFHGGSGGKVKPYVVVSTGEKVPGKPGSFALVRNLDTGELTHVGFNKSFAVLLGQHATAPEPHGPQHASGMGEVYNPAAWKQGEAKPLTDLHVGEKFTHPIFGQAEVEADKGAAWQAKNLQTGATFPLVKSENVVHLLEPNNVMPAVGFDPDAYEEGPTTKLGDMKAGDIFKGTAKGKHYLVTKTGNKSGLTALDLQTGKKSSPWQYTKVAPLMVKKKSAKGGPFAPGFPVPLDALYKGDQFMIDGQLHEVVEPVESAAKNATVAEVLPGGGLGFPGKVGWHPGLMVTYHQSADAAASEKAKLSAVAPELASTDGVPQFPIGTVKPYSVTSKSGGGYYFIQAQHASEGMLLQDKTGAQFKVKVAGSDPVVSDGAKHWKLNGKMNMKIAPSDSAFVDNAGPLTAAHDAPASNFAALMPTMFANDSQKPIGDLGLEAGDWFIMSGAPFKVVSTSTFNVMAIDAAGNKLPFGKGVVPTASSKLGAVNISFSIDTTSKAPNLDTLEGFTKNVALAKVESLPVGSLFAGPIATPGSEVYKVIGGLDGGLIPIQVVKTYEGGPVGMETTTGADFVFGWSAPPLAEPAVLSVPVPEGEWKDNSLVKLPVHMLKPGQFYKTSNGNEWLWHGVEPGGVLGLAELVSDDQENLAKPSKPGDAFQVGPNTVPTEVGPVHEFKKADFEPAGKKLMSQLAVGDVFTVQESSKHLAKVIGVGADGKLHVVASTGTPAGTQSAPYAVEVAQGTVAHLFKAQAPWDPGAGNPGTPLWTPDSEPPKFGETDEYLVQALVDAHAYHDENGYFEAEAAIANHLVEKGVLSPEDFAQGDTVYGATVQKWVTDVIADRGIKAPAGGLPFDGGDMGYSNPSTFEKIPVGASFDAHDATWKKISATQAEITAITDSSQMADVGYVTNFPDSEDVEALGGAGGAALNQQPFADITVGTEFEDTAGEFGDAGGKYVITKDDGNATTFEPIGLEGEGLAQTVAFDDPSYEADVNVLSAGPEDGWAGGPALGKIDYLHQAPSGSLVQKPAPGDGDTPAIWKVVKTGQTSGMVDVEIVVPGKNADGSQMGMGAGATMKLDGGNGPWRIVPREAVAAAPQVPSADVGTEVVYVGGDPSVMGEVEQGTKFKLVSTDGAEAVIANEDYPDGPNANSWVVDHADVEPASNYAEPPNLTTSKPPPGTPPPTWKPFSAKSKTGGGYTFSDLGDLKVGAKFKDKSGKTYVVKELEYLPGLVQFIDPETKIGWTASSESRVKVV